MKVVIWSITTVACVGMVLSLDPGLIGLSTYLPFAQVVAVRGVVAAALAAFSVAAMLIGAAARQWNKRTPALTVLAVVSLLVAMVHAGTLTVRWNSAPEPAPAATTPAPVGPLNAAPDTSAPSHDEADAGTGAGLNAIRVFTFNTYGNAAMNDRLQPLLAEHVPHIISLQETSATTAAQIQAQAAQSGHQYQLFTAGSSESVAAQTALLVHADLGQYQQHAAPNTTFGTVIAGPVPHSGSAVIAPTVAAIHTVPPLPKHMATWRADLRGAVDLCEQQPGMVVAGDFNATTDHGPLRSTSCTVASAHLESTWPSSQSKWLGATIDHVLADAAAWESASARLIDVPGSDHRAVLAELVPAG